MLAMVHLGSELPDHFWKAVECLRRFSNIGIFLVAPSKSVEENFHTLRSENITPFMAEDLRENGICREFQGMFGSLDSSRDGFWSVTMERFFILENLMDLIGTDTLFHMENDIAVYFDPLNIETEASHLYSNSVALNPCGPHHDAAAFIHIQKSALQNLNRIFMQILAMGRDKIVKMTNHDFVSEMTILRYISKNHSSCVDYLPLLPDDLEGRENLGGLFDCASWGQYVGGTPGGGHQPGCMFDHHWVGQQMKIKQVEFEWGADGEGRKVPFAISKDGRKTRILTLHVHCKDFGRFM